MDNSNKSRPKSRFVKFFLGTLTAIALIFALLPQYLQKGLIYFMPDIDDYKIFPNRTINAGKPIKWPLSEKYNNITLPSEQIDSLEKYKTVSFLVIQNDSILFEKYWDGHSDTTRSNSFSMAKSIVALLVGAALDDGYIHSLDEKVKTHLPWLKGPYRDSLTIRHLLTMSSGSSWDESYNSPFSVTTQAYYGNDLMATIQQIEFNEPPGKIFNYRSGDTQIIERLLNKVTGMTISEYASQKLWQPLGAEKPALWSLDRTNGIEKAYCCFNSTTRDFARLGSLILHQGVFNGRKLISENYIREMATPADYLVNQKGETVDYYGLFWWIIRFKGEVIPYARGILGQYIFVLPKHNAVVVRLGHQRSKSYLNHHPTDVYAWLNTAYTILNHQ
ncbi:serine hydrolase domain-containing protein [Thermophagus xiamenensis]|uniref:CubicO group peptidase, beta-lactamase class C family n=1 Tax=Thermophagus xiamenensis TaxID=385682 RepID=A0A1I1YN68_9BACT|nr:serine hydrolase domain-containing protein [Thermophagus xiamenensis]SFE20478.1 CubicO group peptidase, beta-lactamase class C family [Thermophagus xiamenensis]